MILLDSENDKGMYDALGLSDNPEHPQGFSQFSEAQRGSHLGEKINFKDLPENVQEHVQKRLKD